MPKNFVGESFSVSLTSGPEKNWIKEGGCIKIFRRKFFCLSAENFCRGILYCTNNFGYRKSLDKGGGGSITIFRRSFCLTVLKYFIGEHFGASEKFFYRKFSCIGGGHHGFVELLSHRTETKSFVKEPFCFPEIFWYRKKFMDKRGRITISSRNFHVSQCPKLS